jgi:hypothetical protein
MPWTVTEGGREREQEESWASDMDRAVAVRELERQLPAGQGPVQESDGMGNYWGWGASEPAWRDFLFRGFGTVFPN